MDMEADIQYMAVMGEDIHTMVVMAAMVAMEVMEVTDMVIIIITTVTTGDKMIHEKRC